MPPSDLDAVRASQNTILSLRAKTQALDTTLVRMTAEIARLDEQLAQARSTGDVRTITSLQRKHDQATTKRVVVVREREALSDQLRATISDLQVRIDANDAAPDAPLLLLPVRVETRYSDDRTSVRVRIFPDDIHIDQLERGLSDTEIAAGRAYWSRVWHASEEEADTAWRDLITAVGRTRARWTAMALEPINLANRVSEGVPTFPAPTVQAHRPAMARLLPDHFTIVVVQGTDRIVRTGAVVPPELVIGLFSHDGTPMKQVNGVTLVEGAEWIADYTIAEKNGLAITVPLTQPGKRIDRLLAFGVRRSVDATTSAQDLTRQLLAHASTGGVAFVPPGTPTNNTESQRASWQRRADPIAPPRDPFIAPASSNAAILADALGVPASVFAGLDSALDADQFLAQNAAIALWPASWGTFLDRINRVGDTGAVLSDTDREHARRFACDVVRGRGPLPSIRIGRQPYGVLPVSCLASKLKAHNAFEQRLLDLLRSLRLKWRQSISNVPRIGAGDVDKILPEMLGMAPASFGLRVRTVLSNGVASLAAQVTGTSTSPAAANSPLAAETLIEELLWEDFTNARLTHPAGSLSKSRPLWLQMTDPKRDAAVLRDISVGKSPILSSVLQALVKLGWDKTQGEVDAASGKRIGDVVTAAEGIATDVKERIVGLAARAERNERISAPRFFAEADRVAHAMPTTVHASLIEFQPIASTRTGFGDLTLKSTNATARGQLGALATAAWLNARGRQAELREAIDAWANAMDVSSTRQPQSQLPEHRLVFAETLDCASHRLDAWLTGLIEQRRRTMKPAAQTGLTIGAFGWLENIEPASPRDSDGGFIHAPSLTHAATAGILRSAYLTHNSSATDTGAFSIDLSSKRVRTASYLLDGVRQGQPLSALLGYAIERAMHEADLDRLILSLRTIAPLKQGKLRDRGESVSQEAIEALAANNVVDGIDLIEKYQGKVVRWDAARIRDKLNTKPENNPYLKGAWPTLTHGEWQTVARVIETAAADLDSVADLLMAESMHQLVQGNVMRASAALDAAAGGDSPAPQPDVVASRIDAVPLTHRVLLIAAGSTAWNRTRPRATVSPEVEAWAATRLGDPKTIIVAKLASGDTLSVADANISALDFVYESVNRSVLEHQLRAAIPTWPAEVAVLDMPDGTLNAGERTYGDAIELAASVRALLVHARPATAADLSVAGVELTREPSQSSIDAARTRLQHAIDVLDVRVQTLDAQLTLRPPDPMLLRVSLNAMAAFGISIPTTDDTGLDTIARVALAEARRRIKRAEEEIALPTTPVSSAGHPALQAEHIVAAGQTLFGDGFWVVPAIGVSPTPDAWTAALAPGAVSAPESALRRYLVDAASVRDQIRRYTEVLMLAEAVGVSPTVQLAQLAGAAGSVPSYWVGDQIPEGQPTPEGPVASIVLDIAGAYTPDQPTVALLVDHWVDMLPVRARRGSDATTPADERVTTGVVFQAQAASARAPQTWLLAVSPDGERWNTERIAELLEETLENAKLRLVTYEYGNGAARFLPALYAQSWSLQGEQSFDLRYVAEHIADVAAVPAFIKESI